MPLFSIPRTPFIAVIFSFISSTYGAVGGAAEPDYMERERAAQFPLIAMVGAQRTDGLPFGDTLQLAFDGFVRRYAYKAAFNLVEGAKATHGSAGDGGLDVYIHSVVPAHINTLLAAQDIPHAKALYETFSHYDDALPEMFHTQFSEGLSSILKKMARESVLLEDPTLLDRARTSADLFVRHGLNRVLRHDIEASAEGERVRLAAKEASAASALHALQSSSRILALECETLRREKLILSSVLGAERVATLLVSRPPLPVGAAIDNGKVYLAGSGCIGNRSDFAD